MDESLEVVEDVPVVVPLVVPLLISLEIGSPEETPEVAVVPAIGITPRLGS
jgi:hypothetical protein